VWSGSIPDMKLAGTPFIQFAVLVGFSYCHQDSPPGIECRRLEESILGSKHIAPDNIRRKASKGIAKVHRIPRPLKLVQSRTEPLGLLLDQRFQPRDRTFRKVRSERLFPQMMQIVMCSSNDCSSSPRICQSSEIFHFLLRAGGKYPNILALHRHLSVLLEAPE
jgi:hypothetical protein